MSDVQLWLPPVVAWLDELAPFQLAGFHGLRAEDVQVKDETAEASIVTRYDLETESRLRERVHAAFPNHSFLGEEGGNDVRDTAHYWIVDPIDGTANFAGGIPIWGTSIAYWRDGTPSLAAISFPALRRTYTAVQGGGAHCNGAPLQPTRELGYSMLTSVGLDSRAHLHHALHLRTRVRILGSAIANLCFVADGTFVASWTRGRLWDVAAGALILSEVGAVMEAAPRLATIDLPAYGRNGVPGTTLVVNARAHAGLPALTDFFRPVA